MRDYAGRGNDVSATFIRLPNELKLMVAEELAIHDLNVLARTSREMNELFTRFMYRRAGGLTKSWKDRPYFFLAIDNGNLAAVERFVEAGVSVDMADMCAYPETAIHTCAHNGHVEIAEFLIAEGVNVLAAGRTGRGPLHSAVMGANPKEAMVTLLVEAGADVKAPWGWDTALHMAASKGDLRMVQHLLDLGADPNAAAENGWRPVHFAAGGTSGATVRCLLKAAQNVDVADYDGRTPLHDAAEYGMADCVKALLEMGADVSVVDRSGTTPLLYALNERGNEASVHRILHLGASTMVDHQSRETYADCVPSCRLKKPNHIMIEMLLAAGSDIARANNRGSSPLTWAAARAHTTSFHRA